MPNKFKVGDTVKRVNSSNGGLKPGDEAIIIRFDGSKEVYLNVPGYEKIAHDADNLVLINSNNFMTNLIEKAKLIFKTEPNKTFFKIGIVDSNDSLTTEGVKLYQDWRFKKDAEDFYKEVAKPILEMREESK